MESVASLAADGLVTLSRALLYDYRLVGFSSDIRWFSAPIGAVYMLFVGAVFYRDLFQLGMETSEPAATATHEG